MKEDKSFLIAEPEKF